MPVLTRCEHCNKPLKVPDASINRKVRCPACKEVFVALEQAPRPAKPAPAPPPPPPVSVAPPIAVDDDQLEEMPAPTPMFEDDPEPFTAPRPSKAKARPEPGRKKVQPADQMMLRLFVFLCGILGAAGTGIMGYFWYQEQSENQEKVALVRMLIQAMGDGGASINAELKEFDSRGKAYPFMFLSAGLGFLAGVLGMMRFGIVAGLLMLAAVVGPAIFNPKSLIFTGFFVAGGLFSFMISTSGKARAAAERANSLPIRGRGSAASGPPSWACWDSCWSLATASSSVMRS